MHDLCVERPFCYDCTRIGPVLKLIIEDDEGRKTVVPFVRDEITIGRQEGNTIRLTERNVSRRHARLVRLNGHVVVEDLGSYNGTRINGERIAGQSPLSEGDLIQIGDYDLALQAEGAANAVGPITTKVPTRRQEAEPEEPDRSESEEEAPGDGDEHDHTPPSQASADKRRNSTSIIRLDHVEADRPRKLEDIDTKDAPRLVVLTPDELRGQEFACIRTELRIGRTDDNDITLDHRSLSRTHAKLVREATGEWRVIDMQSANGMTVNGESYAQATLNSGDIVELGHVKLRFMGAGDAGDGEDAPASEGGMSKMPLVAGLIALLLGGGGVAFWMSKQGQGNQPIQDPVVAQPTQPVEPPPAPPVKPPEDTRVPPTAQTGTTAPPETPPEPVKPTTEELMAAALKAFDALDFKGARTELEKTRGADGKYPRDAKKVLDDVAVEEVVETELNKAKQALDANRPDEAKAPLEASAKTKLYIARYTSLKAQYDAKLKEFEAARAKPPPAAVPAAGKEEPPPVANAADALNEQTGQLVARAGALIKKQKYREALAVADQCAKLDGENPDCHLMLGIAKARLDEIDDGAKHYRRFLELAPADHPYRKGVESQLKDYDGRKQ
ncbi:FHA domain-containing protein [Myxococcus sp. CA039A]|nr:FHA domain-containing protein [Myxococcus sp. CA039A]NTX52502.1 FHA domain-containing protein [Myxococcus sp. CA039A]